MGILAGLIIIVVGMCLGKLVKLGEQVEHNHAELMDMYMHIGE